MRDPLVFFMNIRRVIFLEIFLPENTISGISHTIPNF